MKKFISVLAAALLLVGSLAGCGGGKAENGVVNIYNWGEYIDMDLLKAFEQETGIRVNYKTFESNEQMYSVLKQGGVGYDIIIPSDYMISRLIGEDMLEPLNFDNIPEYEYVDESLKGMAYDPDNTYSVPYMWGTTGLIYDPELMGEVDSWAALFDASHAGSILMFDNSRDAMGIALKYLGYSINTTEISELDEAYALLEQQKPILQGYVMDQIFDKLESGEAAIGPYYAGDYLTMRENNPNLKFVVPKEGANVFVDAFCVLKGAANKDNAEAFINFMTRAENSAKNSEFIGYTSPNRMARELLDLDELADSVMYPAPSVLDNCEAFTNLPQETLDYYDALWIKLKS